MTNLLKITFLVGLLTCFANTSYGQFTNLSFDELYEQYRDSLKNTPYPWQLPIMGSKVRKLGFDIPFPNGFSFQTAYSKQDLQISDLYVGFSEENLTYVSNFARFNYVESDVIAGVAKYDFWLLPFLNFFVTGGYINADTNVSLGLPFELNFKVNSQGPTAGWGTVVAGGIGPLVITANFGQNWTWTGSTSQATKTTIFDARTGYLHRFKRRPDRNIVFLVGAQYLGLNPQNSGGLNLEKLVGINPEKKAIASEQLDAWYADLPQQGQQVLEGFYNGVSNFLNNEEPVTLYYQFKKRLYYPISMTTGVNFQLNHRMQFNGIYTFLGSREQLVFGLTYRFGFKGKNLLRGVTL